MPLQQCSGSVLFSRQSHPKEDNNALDFLQLTLQKECVRRRPDFAAFWFEQLLDKLVYVPSVHVLFVGIYRK